jgi:hypothetical protein
LTVFSSPRGEVSLIALSLGFGLSLTLSSWHIPTLPQIKSGKNSN